MKHHPHIQNIIILLLLILLLFPVLSLSGSTQSLPPDNVSTHTAADKFVYLPAVMNTLATIIPDTTEVLTAETTQYLLSVSEDGTIFTFSQTTPELDALDVGDVMVGDVSNATPDGFLRQVSTVTTTGGQVVVTTIPATLEDAIQQGAISISKHLTPADIENITMAQGVSFMSYPDATTLDDNFFFELNRVVLYDEDGDLDTTDDQLQVDGSLEFTPSFDFNLTIKNGTLEELVFLFNVEETVELEFYVETDVVSIEAYYEIARLQLGTVTVFIGPVPVVFLIEMPVYLRGDGDLKVGVTAKVAQTANLVAGLRYKNNTWEPITSLTNSFTFDPPIPSAGVNLTVYIDPPLSLLLYGITGPFASVTPYLELKADAFANPWWELHAGIDATVGVEIDVLGHSLGDHTEVVIGYRTLLAQASASGNISGNITNGTNPLNNIQAEAHQLQNDGLSFLLVATSYSNNGGHYELTGLEDGVYIVRFYDESGAYLSEYHDNTRNRYAATWHTITGGNTVTNINAVLDISSHISGQVIDATNNTPLANIPVWVEDGTEYGSAVTDNNGYYTVHDIPSGSYIVSFSNVYGPRIYMPQYYDHVSDYESATPVPVSQGSTITNINASLLEGGYITGQVTAMDGMTPLENISVRISEYVYGWWLPGYVILTDANGWYQFNGLITGNYRITFFDVAGLYMQEHYDDVTDFGQATDIAVVAGQTTANIDASLTVTSKGR